MTTFISPCQGDYNYRSQLVTIEVISGPTYVKQSVIIQV